jgi:hypothetical protein
MQDHTRRQGLNEQPIFNSVQGGYEMGDREVVVDDPGVEDTPRVQQNMVHLFLVCKHLFTYIQFNIRTIHASAHLPSVYLQVEAVGRHHINLFAMLHQLSTKLHSQLAGSFILNIHLLVTMSSLTQHSLRMNTMTKTQVKVKACTLLMVTWMITTWTISRPFIIGLPS